MTAQSEVKTWWVDLVTPDEKYLFDSIAGTLMDKHPRQGPLRWQASLFPVVRKSDYYELKEQNKKLETLLGECEEFITHSEGCDILKDGGYTCDCGAYKLYQKLKAAKGKK